MGIWSQLAADTFDYMATFSNAARWDPGTLAAEQLDPGPVRAGTRFRLNVAFGGRGMPLTYRITRYLLSYGASDRGPVDLAIASNDPVATPTAMTLTRAMPPLPTTS